MKGRLLGELKNMEQVRVVLDELLALHPEDRDENPGGVNLSIFHLGFLLRDKACMRDQFEILRKVIGDTPTITQKILLKIAEARLALLDGDFEAAITQYQDLIQELQPLGDLWRLGFFQEELADLFVERHSPGDAALAAVLAGTSGSDLSFCRSGILRENRTAKNRNPAP